MAADAKRERHQARLVTVAFVLCEGAVLLLRHPDHNDRWPGQWNGIGGHVEAGEDIRAAAARELREEAGLEVSDLSLRAVVHESGLVGHAHLLFVFVGRTDRRDVASPEGLTLEWHPVEKVDTLPLVHDVELLLHRALAAEEPFFVTEVYAEGDDTPVSVHIDGVAV